MSKTQENRAEEIWMENLRRNRALIAEEERQKRREEEKRRITLQAWQNLRKKEIAKLNKKFATTFALNEKVAWRGKKYTVQGASAHRIKLMTLLPDESTDTFYAHPYDVYPLIALSLTSIAAQQWEEKFLTEKESQGK